MHIDCRVRCQRSIPVGADAGDAYGMVHASPRGKSFPSPAQPFGQMAVQWLTWESAKNVIRLMAARSG